MAISFARGVLVGKEIIDENFGVLWDYGGNIDKIQIAISEEDTPHPVVYMRWDPVRRQHTLESFEWRLSK